LALAALKFDSEQHVQNGFAALPSVEWI